MKKITPVLVFLLCIGNISGNATPSIAFRADGHYQTVITATMNRKEVDSLVADLKKHGISLKFESLTYNNNGKIILIKGVAAFKDQSVTFASAENFRSLMIETIKSKFIVKVEGGNP